LFHLMSSQPQRGGASGLRTAPSGALPHLRALTPSGTGSHRVQQPIGSRTQDPEPEAPEGGVSNKGVQESEEASPLRIGRVGAFTRQLSAPLATRRRPSGDVRCMAL
jgi:hypothetical protein